jgi:hypothetical protein
VSPTKTHVLKVLSPAMELLASGGMFKMWGLMGGLMSVQEMPFKGTILFCSQPWGEWVAYHLLLPVYVPTDSKQWNRIIVIIGSMYLNHTHDQINKCYETWNNLRTWGQ